MLLASTDSAQWVNLVAVVVFAGFTASFLCVVLERRLEGELPTGRSHCVCGAPIPMIRNIPVVTWLLQGGKTHCCGARIPAWYVAAEGLAMLLAMVGAAVAWPHPWVGGLVGTAAAMVVVAVWHRHQNVT